jgi:hypothetical protein
MYRQYVLYLLTHSQAPVRLEALFSARMDVRPAGFGQACPLPEI